MECSAQSIRILASSEQWGLTGSFGLWGGGGGGRGVVGVMMIRRCPG